MEKVNHLKGEHIANEIGASLAALREHFIKELGENGVRLSAEMYPECNLVNSELESRISMDEIINAIKFIKEGKAAGPDRIIMELYKNLLDMGIAELRDIFNKILKEEKVPLAFKCVIQLPIYKRAEIRSEQLQTNSTAQHDRKNIHENHSGEIRQLY